ncbi:MAG: hypothetical protein K2O39_03630 [Clostridiales bacterium]|nr:hypothetical protein [Clostridiales bacterium]
MTPKQKKIVSAVVVLFVVFIIAFFGFIIYITFNTSPTVRKKMINHYSNYNSYVEVYVRIPETPKKGSELVHIGVEFIGENADRFTKNGFGGFCMPASNYDVMVSNGFNFEDTETVYKFLASPAIWWDGGQPFAVAVFSEDDSTVYLDYETGKKNLLYYIKNDMD